jgi:hypothetical protein
MERTRRAGALALLTAVDVTLSVAAQSAAVRVNGGALHVTAPSFHFIKGTLLDRLQDGQSARVAIAVTLFARQAAERLGERQGHFILSYDLWEERFAVTEVGTPSRSISHLTADGAEAWCLERLAIPMTSLSRPIDAPVWLRLESSVSRDEDARSSADTGYTLQGLIDRLSRTRAGEVREFVDFGPLRLTN